jgi:hypothetical protein
VEDYYEYLDSNGVTTLYKLIKDDTVALINGYSVTLNNITTNLDNHVNNSDIHTPISTIENMIDTKVSGLVNSAPETLDTLKELSDALGNDPNFATTVANQIGTKADKDSVYTKLETDTLLEGKANSVHNHVVSDITDFPTIPTKVSQLENDTGFVSGLTDVVDTKSNQTINGTKTFTNQLYLGAGGGSYGLISAKDTNSILRLFGGTAPSNGANLDLYGEDLSDGGFSLRARTSDKIVGLDGKTDGTLKWNGKNVALDENLVHTTGREVISGDKIFQNAIYRQADITTSTVGEVYRFTDTNATPCGAIYNRMHWHNNNVYNRLQSYNATSDKDMYFEVLSHNDGSGVVNTGGSVTNNKNLTTTTSGTDVSYVATMGWVNNPATSTNVVHRSGDETIAGNKTFSNRISFPSGYFISTDPNDNSLRISRSGSGHGNNYKVIIQGDTGKFFAPNGFIGNLQGNADTATSANDPNAVHKTGNETINGVKSFNSLMYIYNNMSNKNSQMDLFTTPANTLYSHYMFVDKNNEVSAYMQYGQQNTGTDFIGLFIHDKNRALHGIQVTTNNYVIPLTNNAYSLGASSNKWANVYATTFNGNLVGGLTLNQSSLKMTVKDSNSETTRTNDVILANSSNTSYGINVSFGGSGNTVVGAGESYTAQLNELAGNSSENLYLTADGNIYFKPNANTFANAKTITLSSAAELSGLAKVTSTSFVGALTGNVTGNCSGSSGSCTGNAATATSATKASCLDNYSNVGGNKIYLDWDHQVKGYVGLKVDNTVMGGLITTKNIGSQAANSATYATTQATSDNSTKIATTAWVRTYVNSVVGSGSVGASISAYYSTATTVTATGGVTGSGGAYPADYSDYINISPTVGTIYTGSQLFSSFTPTASGTINKVTAGSSSVVYQTTASAKATFSGAFTSSAKYLCTTANAVKFRAYVAQGTPSAMGSASVVDQSSSKSIFMRIQ